MEKQKKTGLWIRKRWFVYCSNCKAVAMFCTKTCPCCGIEMENDLEVNDKDKEAKEKLDRWMSDIGLTEDKECNEEFCELIREEHQHD